MSLNPQSNWNAEMEEDLARRQSKNRKNLEDIPSLSTLTITFKPNAQQIPLPSEIISQIISYIPRREAEQKTLWACCLVSRAWYHATIQRLYERPYLKGRNFEPFVSTICPSKNAHIRRSELSGFIKTLDMGDLVHDGSKSLTARLLGRLKGNLEEFVAPQASFSINSFAALSKCKGLKYLNLSLMSASISIKVLFHALQSLTQLETLFLPRTSNRENEHDEAHYAWPPKLKALHLAGGIDDFFLRVHVTQIPTSVDRLSIQHCSQVYASSLHELLVTIGPQLKHLTIRHPLPQLPLGALDYVLLWCPNLIALRISADYITDNLFKQENVGQAHPLRILELDCSPQVSPDVEISPDSIWIAIDGGWLPDLRSVRVSPRLAWTATQTLRNSTRDLADLLEEQEEKKPLAINSGVFNAPLQ